jgi:hypothetical protein
MRFVKNKFVRMTMFGIHAHTLALTNPCPDNIKPIGTTGNAGVWYSLGFGRAIVKNAAKFLVLATATMLIAGTAFAMQASDPQSRQSGEHFAGYEACRLAAQGDATDIDECAGRAVDMAAARLGSSKITPETIAAARAFSEALPAIGDIAIFNLGQGEESALARIAVSDGAVALAEARADLLSGTLTAPSAPFALFAMRGGLNANTLFSARTLWAKSLLASCAAYAVPRCAARYDALLGIFARKAGLLPPAALARPLAPRPRAKTAPRKRK